MLDGASQNQLQGQPEQSVKYQDRNSSYDTLSPVPEDYASGLVQQTNAGLSEYSGEEPGSNVLPHAKDCTHTRPAQTPQTPEHNGERTLKRTISKTVRFSTSSGSDEEDDFPIDMTQMGGKRWKSLTEFSQLKEIYRGRISLV
eukprot:CAMPEP_0177603414 /NCGR_PEP_ID=MMETSP0419_2-20121207/15499_1 /TAXON_ID=582737 /ORGANISM="Tetraselmis sp., Strain GSL018" /LENGTH=142 /DNA_ID=CAMNT_0019097183 /DNA_START=150 /DNA_END=575 /DNA_ORIENTATION=-